MNENKVPCGGFYLGDGLAMDGDTLKSLGGAYVKVKTNDGETFEFMDDSPLKTFEEIRQKAETSIVTLQMLLPDTPEVYPLFYDGYNGSLLNFCGLSIFENTLIKIRVSIDVYNKITFSRSQYTLTPAT